MSRLFGYPKFRAYKTDGTGTPLAGGKLYTYANETTTPLATYSDADHLAQNTNPIILDSNGEAWVFPGDYTYTWKLTDADDVLIWEKDGIGDDLSASAVSLYAADVANTTDLEKGSHLVGYKAPLTGSVGKPVFYKLVESVSVWDFLTEAQVQGSPDITAALTAALATGANVIHIPGGDYTISGTVVLGGGAGTEGVTLVGDGMGDTADPTAPYSGTNIIVLTGASNGFSVQAPTSNITFKDMTIRRQTKDGTGITCGAVDLVTLENVRFYNCTDGVSYSSRATRLQALGSVFNLCDRGIYVATYMTRSSIDRCELVDCIKGIYVDAGGGGICNAITRTTITGPAGNAGVAGTVGIRVKGCTNTMISGCNISVYETGIDPTNAVSLAVIDTGITAGTSIGTSTGSIVLSDVSMASSSYQSVAYKVMSAFGGTTAAAQIKTANSGISSRNAADNDYAPVTGASFYLSATALMNTTNSMLSFRNTANNAYASVAAGRYYFGGASAPYMEAAGAVAQLFDSGGVRTTFDCGQINFSAIQIVPSSDGIDINNTGGANAGTARLAKILLWDRSAGSERIITSGTGSPESVVTAKIGSLYLRTDGSTSTTLYVKTSGTGNTGWTAK